MSAPTPEQAELIAALVDTLVPADESGPGGTQAGVDAYIGSVIASNETMRSLYDANLARLESFAGESFDGAKFTELDFGRRTELLKTLESGGAEDFIPDAATFFAILRHHMLEGLFGDPQYGGNVDFAGWKLVGYRGVKLIQTKEDQAIDGAPERPLTSRKDALAAVGK